MEKIKRIHWGSVIMCCILFLMLSTVVAVMVLDVEQRRDLKIYQSETARIGSGEIILRSPSRNTVNMFTSNGWKLKTVSAGGWGSPDICLH